MIAPLMDEHSTPPLRSVLGRLLSTARRADFAVARVRLAAIDLTAEEGAGVHACRFLLGRLDAASLPTTAGSADAAGSMRGLRALITAGRIEIRSAGLATWSPDFSLFHGLPVSDAARDVCVLGAHYFGEPPTLPAFTCMLDDPSSVAAVARRFESLWQDGHDVAPVVLDSIDRLLGHAR